jgi:predicted ATPase/DNA-binding SARP family transcriptional activator
MRGVIGSDGRGRLEFRVLGPLEVRRDGEQLRLGGERQRALLAVLLIRANELVGVDQLVELLSGGQSSDGARNALHVAVSRLRRALEGRGDDGVLLTRAGGYVLQIPSEQLDATVFEARLQEARGQLAAGDALSAAARLREALGMWRGEPFADLSLVDCIQPEVRRLEELRMLATMDRVDADLALGAGAELVGELEELTVAEPLQERLRGQLMLALYRSGRQADALAVYRQTSELLREELGLEPSSALQELERGILQQDPTLLPVPVARSRIAPLPSPVGPIIGRERETEAAAELLARAEVRLVTLVGPGGVGKTRLALAIARALEPDVVEGVAWIELAGLTRPQEVASTISQALDVTALPGESARDALSRVVSERRLLLVIDNFEHVLEAATVVGELVHDCSGVSVLATSRQALGLAAEHCVMVEPLMVPDQPEHATVSVVETTSATAMFIAAARRHDARFVVGSDTAAAVARVCTRLDGLPLAIELAAARTQLLGVVELASRLETRLGVLGAGPRDAPLRQRTLQDTIDWSYQLLGAEQQAAFRRFAVFAGGATVQAAEEVTEATLEAIEALAAKSLVTRQPSAGSSRLVMLETVRVYALDRLAADPEEESVRRRHLLHFLRLAADAKPKLWTPEEPEAVAILDREIDNLRAALQWGIEQEPELAVRLAGPLAEYWWVRQDPDALGWVDAALAAGEHLASVRDRADTHMARAWLLGQRSDPEGRAEGARVALELYRELGDHIGISRAFTALGATAQNQGDVKQERTYAEQACLHARESGDDASLGVALARLAQTLPAPEYLPVLAQARELLEHVNNHRQVATAYMNIAFKALGENRPVEALALLEVAEPVAEKLSDPGALGLVCGNLGLAHLFLGHLERARQNFRREIVLCGQETFRFGVEEGIAGLAAIAADEGSPVQAATLIGAAHAHGHWLPGDRLVHDKLESQHLDAARATLGAESWHRAEHAGASMTYEQAISYALRISQPRPLKASGAAAAGGTPNTPA